MPPTCVCCCLPQSHNSVISSWPRACPLRSPVSDNTKLFHSHHPKLFCTHCGQLSAANDEVVWLSVGLARLSTGYLTVWILLRELCLTGVWRCEADSVWERTAGWRRDTSLDTTAGGHMPSKRLVSHGPHSFPSHRSRAVTYSLLWSGVKK